MKKILTLLVLITFSISVHVFSARATDRPPEKGEALPVINLPIPKNPEERNYLGLSGSGFFKIPQIKAHAVIVELFSMYCPFCQKDAPGVNELYRLIETNPDIKNKVKLIGISTSTISTKDLPRRT
jgi:protein-disulfide isomerase